MQFVAVPHDTDVSTLLPSPTSGVETIDHTVPLEDSISVCSTPDPLTYLPDAVQELGAVHETPVRMLFPVPSSGVVTTDQSDPSQDSTSVLSVPDVSTSLPTAMQLAALVHETEIGR